MQKTKQTRNLVELTEGARQKVVKIAEESSLSPIIRAGVKGGGCSGYSYVLFFEKEADINDTDSVIQLEEVKVVVDMMSMTYLKGTTIDYVEGLTGAGFKFLNPTKKTCGCGSSFSL